MVGKSIHQIVRHTISPDHAFADSEGVRQFVAHDRFRVYAHDGSEVGIIASEAELDEWDDVVGVVLAGEMEWELLDAHLHVSVEDVVAESSLTGDDFPVGAFQVAAVHPGWQGCGVGREVVETVLQDLQSPVVAMVWDRYDAEQQANMHLARQYFTLEERFADVTSDDWRCRHCGVENRCRCGSALFVRY